MTHVRVVTMMPEDTLYRHCADRVFLSLDDAKSWAEQRLRHIGYRPEMFLRTRWFDAPGVVSNYTDADGERIASIARQEIVA